MGKGLSAQEKAILEVLQQAEDHEVGYRILSWIIAERYDRDRSRIWKYVPREGRLSAMEAAFAHALHPKGKFLTPAHRASFSRSIRRLVSRGLIGRVGCMVVLAKRDRDGNLVPLPTLDQQKAFEERVLRYVQSVIDEEKREEPGNRPVLTDSRS